MLLWHNGLGRGANLVDGRLCIRPETSEHDRQEDADRKNYKEGNDVAVVHRLVEADKSR